MSIEYMIGQLTTIPRRVTKINITSAIDEQLRINISCKQMKIAKKISNLITTQIGY